jgi:excisionase family DNA binding protein
MTQKKNQAEIERLLTIDEACEVLNISRTTFNRMKKKGQIKIVKIGPRRLGVKPEELRRYINRRAA